MPGLVELLYVIVRGNLGSNRLWTCKPVLNANVASWLLSDILADVLERLLIPRNQTSGTECQLWRETRPLSPQQQTLQPACPLSRRRRLLLGAERTYGRGVCGVRC